jgi:drug/metabolite transporter (DMT)-like permease
MPAGTPTFAAMPSATAPWPVYLKLVGVAAIWGGTFVAGRIVAPELPATTAALWRYVFASVVLVAAALVLEGGLPPLSARQWIGVTLLGATGVAAYNLCFMWGLKTVPAGRASLIVALNPAATLAGAALFLGERLDRRKVAGILIALAGAAIVIGRGNPVDLFAGGLGTGELTILGCVASWSAFTLVAKRLMAGLSPLAVTVYASLTGTLMLAAATFVEGAALVPHDASWPAWLALAFLGTFGTAVAFVWFNDGVRRLGAARAPVFINLVPVFAVALGALVLGERIDASTAAGGVLVLAGVYALNAPRRGG